MRRVSLTLSLVPATFLLLTMVNSEFARPALGDDGDCGGVQEVVTMDNVVRCESLGAIKIECKASL